MSPETIQFDRRKSGISLLGDLHWGSHFCQFYSSINDLFDIVVPYFRAGLQDNEFCAWVVSGDDEPGDLMKTLTEAEPLFAQYAAAGQLGIFSLSHLHADQAIRESVTVGLLDKAVSAGFEGLRLVYDAFPPEAKTPQEMLKETAVIGTLNVLANFVYPRGEFDASGLMEVVKNHSFALVRNAEAWEVIESSEARVVKDALRRSEEKLKSLFSNMSEGFAYHRIVLDDAGSPCDYVFLDVNQAFEDLTGLRAEDVIGKRVTDVIPGIENDPTNWIGKYGQVAMTGKPAHFESYAAELERWYSVSAFSPHKAFFAVTFTDITGRMTAEKEIRHRNELLDGISAIFKEALVCQTGEELAEVCLRVAEQITRSKIGFIGEIGLDGLLHDLAISNPGWEQCKMYEETGHRKPPGDFVLHGIYGRVLLDGEPFFTNDPASHPDSIGTPLGHPPLEAFLGVPLKRGSETIGMIAVGNRDGGYREEELDSLEALAPAIVEALYRVRAEEELQSALLRLERSNADLQQFAYVASHDLQEPLRMVSSFVSLLKRNYFSQLDGEAREYIDFAVDGAVRMQVMIQDLLAYSRVGTQGGKFIKLDSKRALGDAVDNLQLSIRETGATIVCDQLPSIYGDPTQMIQLFQNLISNAIKFRSDQAPVIKIRAERQDGEWIFSVSDNGLGIESSYADRIFIIFQRLHDRLQYPGTGIGLAICKRIVERHGGRIWMESEPGSGSVFRFTITSAEA